MSTPTTSSRLWRPAQDAPLFPGELLTGPDGLGALDDALRERVVQYLAAVVHARRFPLHVSVLWNALHYGYDVSAGGYTETLLNADAFPLLDPAEFAATPTGAMVRLPGGTPVWAEVVHDELDDPLFDDDGDLPPAHSGAPVDEHVRARVVFDPCAFGALLPEQHASLTRLGRKKVLDRFGHLTGPVSSDAGVDRLTRYASWLVSDAARLGGGPVTAAVGSTDPNELIAAVVASMQALLVLLAADDTLEVVGEHVRRAGVSALDRADADDVTAQVLRVRRGQVRYTGVGVTLRALPADRPVRGTGYLDALVDVTARLRLLAMTSESGQVRLRLDDAARGGGVWRSTGVALEDPAPGIHPLVPLGLGHAGGAGGHDERAEPEAPTAPAQPEPAAPDEPGPQPDPEPGPEPAPEPDPEEAQAPAPAEEPDDADGPGDGLLGDLEVTASHLTYTVTLRPRHLADGTLPYPAELSEYLDAADRPLAARLGHPGGELAHDETFHSPLTRHDEPRQLRGIAWPLQFHPGLLVTATFTVGGRILDVTSELLADPVLFAGTPITHATDLAILAAALGQPAPGEGAARAAAGPHVPDAPTPGTGLDGAAADDPGSSVHGSDIDDTCGTGGPVTDDAHADRDLSDARLRAYLALLLRTMLRAVPADPDGTRTFSAAQLVTTAYAGWPLPVGALGRAHRLLDAHAHRGRLLRLPGTRRFVSVTAGFVEDPPSYVWWPPGQPPPRRARPSGPGPVRHPHQVPITIRHLPSGWAASPDKLAAWPAVRAALGDACLLPWELPPGATWVEEHARGHDPGWESAAVRT